MDKILKVENIHKKFKTKNEEIYVLKGISFELNKGEIAVILGPSGAGKSTLLNIIGTLLKPDSGKILFNNKDILSLNEKELSTFRNKTIGFIFQFYHLFSELTVIENVLLPARIYNKKYPLNLAMELLEILNLKNKINQMPTDLSCGEQQRVSIARAFINSPELILADEPTGNLDFNNAYMVKELLYKTCKQKNCAMIIVTHNELFTSCADRVFFLKEGGLYEKEKSNIY
jgi:ABC-type lipoprotein export system ATPase subunit